MPNNNDLLENSNINISELLNETKINLSFSGIQLAIGAILLKVLITFHIRQDNIFVPLILIYFTISSSFFSALFYANASGGLDGILEVSESQGNTKNFLTSNTIRQNRKRSIKKALDIGSTISEYFGVYPLIAAIPLVFYYNNSPQQLWVAACVISYVSFFLYHYSGLDILSRTYKNNTCKKIIVVSIEVLMILMFLFYINTDDYIASYIGYRAPFLRDLIEFLLGENSFSDSFIILFVYFILIVTISLYDINRTTVEEEPVIGKFLDFLAKDMIENPQHIQVIDSDLVIQIQSMVEDVGIDLDMPLLDEDE